MKRSTKIIEGSTPLQANSTVDKLAAVSDTKDTHYVPKDKIELRVALADIVASTAVEDISKVWDALAKAMKQSREDVGDDTMTTKKNSKIKTEAQLRGLIRGLVKEAFIAPEPGMNEEEEEEVELEPAATPAAGTLKKKRSNLNKEGEDFSKMAAELGLSVAGAKRATQHALAKANYLATEFDEDLDVLILQVLADYIDTLAPELDPEEVQALKDNPGIVTGLDSFKHFMDKEVRKYPGYKEHVYKFIGKDPATGRNIK